VIKNFAGGTGDYALMVFAGLIVLSLSANQYGYHRDLKRLEAENHHRRKPIRRRDR